MVEEVIELVTFDAAGTLISHSWDPAGTALAACRELGLSISQKDGREKYSTLYSSRRQWHEEVEKRRDASEIKAFWMGLIAEWLSELGQDPALSRDVYEISRRRVFSKDSSMWSLFPDVLPTLETLANVKVRLGIISNWDGSLHTILENLGIASYFEFVLASLQIGIEKPARGIFDEALKLTGGRARSSLHVGDDFFDDYQGARDAGWNALLLDRSGSASSHNAHRISSLAQVVEVATN